MEKDKGKLFDATGLLQKAGSMISDAGKTIGDQANKLKEGINQEDIMNFLQDVYGKSLNGIPNVSPPINEFASGYLTKSKSPQDASRALINNQVLKCATSGFVTGFGGFLSMPVTLPANITSVLYIQMRMIAATAYLAGFDVSDDHVQTLVFACLAGVAVSDVIKNVGIKFAVKFTESMVKKIPGKTLTKINQKVGFRFLTKFGSKGIINIGKMIPFVGAVVGGGFDYAETVIIGNRAYQWFFEHDFSVSKSEDDGIIEIDNTVDIAQDADIQKTTKPEK